MQRVISTLILLVFIALFPAPSAKAWFFDDILVSIDGTDYTTENFKHWWSFWKEEGTTLPETPDPYVDW